MELSELVFPARPTAWFEAGESGKELSGLRRVEAAAEVAVMAMRSEWIWRKAAESGCGFH